MAITRVTWTDDSGAGTDGTILNNANLDSIYDSIEDTWAAQSYVPTWGNTGTANTLTNATITGSYFYVGKKVHFIASVTFGAATAVGDGQQTITVPVALSTLGAIQCIYTNTGTASYLGTAVNTSSTVLALYTNASPITNVTASVPFAFGNTDVLVVKGWYFAS